MRKQHAAAAAAFVVLSVVMTWPLVRNLDRAVAYPGDPYINIWILDWDHYATFHEPLALFDANAFHPARYSLAFSENLYGIALLLVPVRLAGVPPITAYNLAMLAGFAFSGFAAYLLGFRLTANAAASMCAGVFYAFVPFRFTHLSHVQHVWGGWLPMLVLTLLIYVDNPSWRRAVVFGLVFLMNALTNIHWFLFGSVAIGLTVLALAAAGHRRWRELIVTVGFAMILLAPFFYPYFVVSRVNQMTRGEAETKAYSAVGSDWLVANFHNRLYAGLRDAGVDPERWLFPGFLSIACALIATVAFRRYPRAAFIAILWIVIGFIGSLGLNSFFHAFLYDAVPGFKAIRAPARWAAIAYVGMSMLVAIACSIVPRRWWPVAWILPFAFIAELWSAPIRWYIAEPDPPPVYAWLSNQRSNGAVIELPLDVAGSEYTYLLRASAHHRRLANGVSGFAPPEFIALNGMWKTEPIGDEFISELRRIGVETIVVHADHLGAYDASTRDWLRRELARGRLHFKGRFDNGVGGDWVFSTAQTGMSVPQKELEMFLLGQPTMNADTFGRFDAPPMAIKGPAFFTGFAFSPYGIRGVDLLFENGSVRIPAQLFEETSLSKRFAGYPTPKPRFASGLGARPPGVRRESDVQAEIIDGRGHRKRLDHFWIVWQ